VVRQHTPYVFLNIVLPSNRFRALACTLLGLNFTEHLYSVKSLVVVLAEQSCLIRNIGHMSDMPSLYFGHCLSQNYKAK